MPPRFHWLSIGVLVVALVMLGAMSAVGSTKKDPLFFLHARMLDPELGRFLTPDSLDLGGNVRGNPYTYANSSPIRYADPAGTMSVGQEDEVQIKQQWSNLVAEAERAREAFVNAKAERKFWQALSRRTGELSSPDNAVRKGASTVIQDAKKREAALYKKMQAAALAVEKEVPRGQWPGWTGPSPSSKKTQAYVAKPTPEEEERYWTRMYPGRGRARSTVSTANPSDASYYVFLGRGREIRADPGIKSIGTNIPYQSAFGPKPDFGDKQSGQATLAAAGVGAAATAGGAYVSAQFLSSAWDVVTGANRSPEAVESYLAEQERLWILEDVASGIRGGKSLYLMY